MTNYLIIGNGAAGTTAAENIRKNDKDGSITMVTDEDLPFYYRLRLNEYVSGDITEQGLKAKKDVWYEENGIDLRLRTRVTGADPENKVLITSKSEKLSYDSLLIATGSHSFVPPIDGADNRGVFTLRNVQDARDIMSYAGDIENGVIVGGGLLGLESGNAFRKLGKRVLVVEFFPRLLPRQLDLEGAKRLQTIMEGMGFDFRLGAKTGKIETGNGINSIHLERGESIPADMVVISAGVRPNMELAGPLGLETDKGIKVDDRLKTNRDNVFAAGDVAEYNGLPYGIWPAAMEQGKIAGSNMAGGDITYKGTIMANILKVAGIDLASAGNIDAENEHESGVSTSETSYKKIVMEDNRIIGCIMLGDTRGFNNVTKAMSENKDISGIKDRILSEGFDFNGL